MAIDTVRKRDHQHKQNERSGKRRTRVATRTVYKEVIVCLVKAAAVIIIHLIKAKPLSIKVTTTSVRTACSVDTDGLFPALTTKVRRRMGSEVVHSSELKADRRTGVLFRLHPLEDYSCQ